MTTFEAYLITSLIPNMGERLNEVSQISIVLLMTGFAFYIVCLLTDQMKQEVPVIYNILIKATISVIILCMLSVVFPSTAQMAAILGLKAITKEGPTQDFINECLKEIK